MDQIHSLLDCNTAQRWELPVFKRMDLLLPQYWIHPFHRTEDWQIVPLCIVGTHFSANFWYKINILFLNLYWYLMKVDFFELYARVFKIYNRISRAWFQLWLDYLPDPEEGTIVPSTPAFFGDFWPMACFSRFKLAIRAKDKGFPLSPMSPVFISGPEAFPASDVEDSESDAPRNKLFSKLKLSKIFFKGQIISECPFDGLNFPKKINEKIWQISSLKSKKWWNQQNKATFL